MWRWRWLQQRARVRWNLLCILLLLSRSDLEADEMVIPIGATWRSSESGAGSRYLLLFGGVHELMSPGVLYYIGHLMSAHS